MIIAIDMGMARGIQRERIRAMRNERLAVLDTQELVALVRGDEQALTEIGAIKQALRDAPADPRIENAKTPEELKEAIPDVLKG